MKKSWLSYTLFALVALLMLACEPLVKPSNTFSVVFDANGGKGNMEFLIVNSNYGEFLPENTFTRKDYAFIGWNTAPDGSGTSYNDRQELKPDQNLKLYAQWVAVRGSENGYEWVMMDLDSGLKWAVCNVGADKPEDYGDYFAWGETSPKADYSLSTYKYYDNVSKIYSKYVTESNYGVIDKKTTLDLSDDAARVNMGGRWRTPSEDELESLYGERISTAQNDINGFMIISYDTGQSLFFPAAGNISGTTSADVGCEGHYMLNSLYEIVGEFYPYSVLCSHLGTNFTTFGFNQHSEVRGDGMTIRAVFTDNDVPSNFANVTFDANGGSGTMAPQVFEIGSMQPLIVNVFTRAGHKFIGWNTAADGSGTAYSDMQSIIVSEDITLYAQWEDVTITVIFDANGGTGTMKPQIFEEMVEQALNANTFTRDGYAFIGWNTEADGSGTAFQDQAIAVFGGSSTRTLYAQWAEAENGFAFIDLGLPSGTKWAICNVGATRPEERGNYYAWGEIAPKSNYVWSTYKYYNNESSSITKYNSNSSYGVVDNKTALELSDDVARVVWGGRWRIPTMAERDELKDNCTWTRTTQNGESGYKVTSKINGNSIFLPAAGYREGTGIFNFGSCGYYWLNIVSETNPRYAYYMYVGESVDFGNNNRNFGHMVRAVISDDIPENTATYTVTFNANGGEGTMSPQVFQSGVPQHLNKNTFTRSGYDFAGWNSEPDGSGSSLSDGASIVLNDFDVVLYAQWKVLKGLENGFPWVDLGLPSGLKWAICNVGASRPEEYGDYFAWGETKPKTIYDVSTYEYCNGSSSSLNKYNTSSDFGTVDNKTTLELSDDAARANWGGSWRMPTKAEQDELRNKCTWTWTSQNGVNGYQVTSKTNGNSIFLPAAGYYDGVGLNKVGADGYYWSSMLFDTYPSYARRLSFYTTTIGWYDSGRFFGRSVRAVCP